MFLRIWRKFRFFSWPRDMLESCRLYFAQDPVSVRSGVCVVLLFTQHLPQASSRRYTRFDRRKMQYVRDLTLAKYHNRIRWGRWFLDTKISFFLLMHLQNFITISFSRFSRYDSVVALMPHGNDFCMYFEMILKHIELNSAHMSCDVVVQNCQGIKSQMCDVY